MGADGRSATWIRTEDGVDLFVEEYGPADAPLTVVLLHGWTLDRRIWRHQVAHLPSVSDAREPAASSGHGEDPASGRRSERKGHVSDAREPAASSGHGEDPASGRRSEQEGRVVGGPLRVVAYDHRGHGRSGPTAPERMTVAQLGDDLAAVLRCAVPAGPVVLAGHSIGGMAMMALAEGHPRLFAERVAGIACVNTSCGGLADLGLGLPRPLARMAGRVEAAVGRQLTQPPGDSVRGRGVRVTAARLASRGLISRPGLRWLLFGRRPPRGSVRLTAETVAATAPETVVGFRATFAGHERRAALAAYRGVPTVVLGGTADRLCPPEHPEAIAAELPDAELVMFPGAGHMLPLERPVEVTRRLAAVVQRARDPRAAFFTPHAP